MVAGGVELEYCFGEVLACGTDAETLAYEIGEFDVVGGYVGWEVVEEFAERGAGRGEAVEGGWGGRNVHF